MVFLDICKSMLSFVDNFVSFLFHDVSFDNVSPTIFCSRSSKHPAFSLSIMLNCCAEFPCSF